VGGCGLVHRGYQPSAMDVWCTSHPDEVYAAAGELGLIDTAPPGMAPSPLPSGVTIGFEGISDYNAACQRAYEMSLQASPQP
jgi:hypothetical protein